MRYKAELKIHW